MSEDPAKPQWRYTEAADAAQRKVCRVLKWFHLLAWFKKWERLMASRPPRKNISPRLFSSNSKTESPLLYYGWPFKERYLIEYAKRHHLSFRPPNPLRTKLGCGEEFNFAEITEAHFSDKKLITGLRCIARVLSLTKLIKATGAELVVGRPFTFDYPYILVMWTNYNIEKQYGWLGAFGKYDKVVKILDDAMNEYCHGQRTNLHWWWSWENDVVCSL
ncbi:hypothetical protein C8Q80DRAFT_483752 [Daedaleopsis nitida]|nr:hypothetical protein C8Q80DRAFT_483752 [Daedaleopsis nitida]